MSAPAGAIGSETWPGLVKLLEECGETIQVGGKLLAYPLGGHPDGTDILQRISDETADTAAIIEFFTEVNHHRLSNRGWTGRRLEKLERFRRWHEQTLRGEATTI